LLLDLKIPQKIAIFWGYLNLPQAFKSSPIGKKIAQPIWSPHRFEKNIFKSMGLHAQIIIIQAMGFKF
jgi:hypothetical protein